MGNKLINVATTEAHPNLANAMRKIGRAWHSVADLDQAQAISECVILGDSLGYQGMNSRAAKETLQQRTSVLEEYQQAVKTTISKRRNIERLKASSSIRPEKVDEALEEMEEVWLPFLVWTNLPSHDINRQTNTSRFFSAELMASRKTYIDH
jgi:predicted RNase H-like nuclease (RuvC/YqgF family)